MTGVQTCALRSEKDNDVRVHLSKVAKKEIAKTRHRKFVKGIIEELASL